jgi:hypothetical protein
VHAAERLRQVDEGEVARREHGLPAVLLADDPARGVHQQPAQLGVGSLDVLGGALDPSRSRRGLRHPDRAELPGDDLVVGEAVVEPDVGTNVSAICCRQYSFLVRAGSSTAR